MLKLKKNSTLELKKWDRKTRKYVYTDVTRNAYFYFNERCDIEKGFKVKHFFQFLKKFNLYKFYAFPFDSYYEECQKKAKKKFFKSVELYWWLGSLDDKEISGFGYPYVHGIGKDNKQYAIDFTPISEIANCDIKINPKAKVYYMKRKVDLGNIYCNLGQILYSLLWEISFHGTPENRDKVFKGLQESIKSIKMGKYD